MRELKFRFYDHKITRKMIYQMPYEAKNVIFDKWETTPKCSPLMQFTGLHDKKGTPIFEGDIVKGKAYEFNGCPRIIGEVVYDYCEFKVKSARNKTSKLKAELNTTYEVIGNIYENPELLEQP